jgi:hypothetical protein
VQSAVLLFSALIALVFFPAAGVSGQPEHPAISPQPFIELDSEIQTIKEEILGINRDILMLKELALPPADEQLVVLVSVAAPGSMLPTTISLRLDGQAITRHDYTASESEALRGGGAHRLYVGRIGEGEHRLEVVLSGRKNGDKSLTLENSIPFTKEPGQKYLELQLGLDKRERHPELTIRQWQQ